MRGMQKKNAHFRVQCPCCDAVLTVHNSTGEILFTEKPKKKGLSFDEALQQVKRDQETAEDRFREAFAKEESRMKSVEDKFQEALKRADELEEPIRPLDYD
jgi:hypothetical protein